MSGWSLGRLQPPCHPHPHPHTQNMVTQKHRLLQYFSSSTQVPFHNHNGRAAERLENHNKLFTAAAQK